MDRNYYLQLTQNLYRLTLLFPKKEPLRYKMRELADDILADLILPSEKGSAYSIFTEDRPLPNLKKKEEGANSIISQLEVLDSFFEVAKNQNWVSPHDILNLQEEYSKLKEELKNRRSTPPLTKNTQVGPVQVSSLNEQQQKILDSNPPTARQGKILEYLKEKGKTQVWEMKQIFPEVSKRTLRRDFEFLLKQGKIERIGERNETFYQLTTPSHHHPAQRAGPSG